MFPRRSAIPSDAIEELCAVHLDACSDGDVPSDGATLLAIAEWLAARYATSGRPGPAIDVWTRVGGLLRGSEHRTDATIGAIDFAEQQDRYDVSMPLLRDLMVAAQRQFGWRGSMNVILRFARASLQCG